MLGNPPSFFQGYLSSEDKRFYQEPKGGKMLSALPAPHPRHTLRLRFGRWGGGGWVAWVHFHFPTLRE